MRSIYVFAALLLLAGVSFGQNLPKFSGLFFGDYYYTLNNHDATQKDMQAFDYRRIYLTADYSISDNVMARFRLESDPTASNLATTTGPNNGKLSTMVKDAWFRIDKVTDGGNIIVGLQGTPEINMAEGIFGYRPLEKTIQDLHGISSSRDMGVSFNQKFSDQLTAGILVGNNSGNSTMFASAYRYKAGYLYIQYNPMKELTVLVNGQYNGGTAKQYNKTADIIVNYGTKTFSIGAQYFVNGINDKETNGSTLTRSGLSLNGWVTLVDDLNLVARYDNYIPDSNPVYKATSLGTTGENFILAGLDWTAAKNVHFMPNVEYTSYASYGSTSPNPDVLARVTFYTSF
jgi:hypothetical protein